MRVEKLELIGFKSFADKTVFNLHHGITCIVGPNGCGKSNVVDSFKWVLGEQSAKSLRGEKMEEVIFAGSQTKKPKGMAEVSLYVSGLDSPENGEPSITAVSRRLYRSGDSDYMLNRFTCRLKDVKDLFLDTGLEMKSYSIFEQDRIAGILNAKPQDRRFLIEEVAGVVKYKVRRLEAQSKLEHSRMNLQRIGDIIAEVKRQINSLDRQVKKAERYKRLMAELREVELRIAKKDHQGLVASLRDIQMQYDAMRGEEASLRAELTSRENSLESKRLGLLEREKALDEKQGLFHGLEMDMAEAERVIAVLETEAENLSANLERQQLQREETEHKIISLTERKEEIFSLDASLSAEMEALREALGMKNEALQGLGEQISDMEAMIETKRKEIFNVSDELAGMRNELHTLKTGAENLRKKEASAMRESEDSEKDLGQTISQLNEAAGKAKEAQERLLCAGKERDSLSGEIASAEGNLESLKAQMNSLREELASDISRLEALREIVLDPMTRDMLQGIGTLAPVSDIMDVPKEYEKAIECALRETINGFVVETAGDAGAALETLRGKDIGRTAFVPLDVHLNVRAGHNEEALPPAAIGRASELVGADGRYFSIIKALLRDVIVVKDLASALSMHGNGSVTFVTLEGEVIEPTGAFIGGQGRGLLMRKRQTRELEAEIDRKKSMIKDTGMAIENSSALLAQKKEALRAKEAEAVEAEKEISLLGLTVDKYKEEQERTDRKLTLLKVERQETLKEIVRIEKEAQVKEAAIREASKRKDSLEKEAQDIRERLTGKKAGHEDEKAGAFDLRLSINTINEKISSLRSELESNEALQEELLKTVERLKAESTDTEALIKQKKEGIKGEDDRLRALILRADELKADIARRKEALAEGQDEAASYEKDIKALRARIDPLVEKISVLDVSKAEHRMQIESIKDAIRTNYSLDIEAAEVAPYGPEDDARLIELKGKIEELGPVSLGTLEEYEELKARYDFLTKQQEDLVKSIAELEEAISRINSTTRKKLREAFEALRMKFSEVFMELFGGGRAELVLTEEGNILETGIDITAQPPGKKLQNINLLSGGEKTLTALSLLFAGFLIKPTPLCILDEADAALDEANTEKFSAMLRSLSKTIQFIVITHNKATMEAADYIYGITMEEPGISKVISLQFQEAPV